MSYTIENRDTEPTGVTFKPDGTKMYMVGGSSDKVYQYTLSTAWDLSTASYDSVSFSVSSQDGTPFDVTFKPDGTKMYIMGNTNKKVYQYTTGYDLSLAEIDTDTYGEYYLTAIANNTKISMTGTPTLGQTLFVGLKDNGSAKTLTWDEINALGVTLPTETTAGKQHIIEIKYIGSAWRAISVGEEE
jgi:DNA-binding beta-propeller fold protein YncE